MAFTFVLFPAFYLLTDISPIDSTQDNCYVESSSISTLKYKCTLSTCSLITEIILSFTENTVRARVCWRYGKRADVTVQSVTGDLLIAWKRSESCSNLTGLKSGNIYNVSVDIANSDCRNLPQECFCNEIVTVGTASISGTSQSLLKTPVPPTNINSTYSAMSMPKTDTSSTYTAISNPNAAVLITTSSTTGTVSKSDVDDLYRQTSENTDNGNNGWLIGILSALAIMVIAAAFLVMGYLNRCKTYGSYTVTSPESDNGMGLQEFPDKTLQAQQRIHVYVAHPSTDNDSKSCPLLLELMKALHHHGIKCSSALTEQLQLSQRGYQAVEKLLKSSNFVLICCDPYNEFKMAWDGRGEDSSRPDKPFQPFRHVCTYIDVQFTKTAGRQLVVVTLKDATANCIPWKFTGTPYYKFPSQVEDLIHILHGEEPVQL